MQSPPRVDVEAASRFLRALYPRGPWALVSIVPDGERGTLRGRTFAAGQIDEMLTWIAEHNTASTISDGAPGYRNVYYHVNPIRPDFRGARPTRQDIAAVHYLHVDVDIRTGEDLTRGVERIRAKISTPPAGIPRASIAVASGGGVNGLWRLVEPIQLDGTLDAAQAACLYNYGIEVALEGDHCHDIARVLRLPGTVNYPNAAKKKRGRAVSVSSICWLDGPSYPLSSFTAVPLPGQTGQGKSAHGPAPQLRAPANVERTGDPEAIRRMVRDKDQVTDQLVRIVECGVDPQQPDRFKSRSDALWFVACELVRLGIKDDDLFGILTDPALGISEHVFAQGAPEKYALRQIERARERAIHPVLARLNDQHTVIQNFGGKCVVVEEVNDPVLARTALSTQSFEDFKKAHCNEHVEIIVPDKHGNPVAKQIDMGTWWLTHKHRAQRRRVVFSPEREVDGDYNLWRGFAYAPRPGRGHEPFLAHVRDNVCSGNRKLYDYVIGWMALAVQHPARPGQTAIVLRGAPGVGKGTLARVFGALWGRHFYHVTNADHLTGRFNGHLRDSIVVFADEAFYAGDKRHAGALKALITEESLSIEDKNVRIEMAPNYVHLIVASNEDWVVPVATGDRRFVVIDVPDTRKGDGDYWRDLNKSLEANSGAGYSHLLHFLSTYDVSKFRVREIPDTDARRDQQMRSLSVDDEWWLGKLESGQLLPGHYQWSAPVSTKRLHDDYILYAQKLGQQKRSSESVLGTLLRKLCPGLSRSRKTVQVTETGPGGVEVVRVNREYCYEFPLLDVCRKAWDEARGARPWADVTADTTF